ncbi:MAG TPA: hypothetical protein VF733_06170 [Candidatus Saccharimonadales bacterium]
MSEVQKTEKKKGLIIAVVILILVIIVGVVFFFAGREGEPDQSREQSLKIIRQVGKLYILPTDEEPTVALITDKSSLSSSGNREFYKNAQNGDYLLVYNKAKIAFLYRQSVHKLVHVSPVIPSQGPTEKAEE